MVTKHQLTKKLHPIEDVFLTNLKNRWFEEPQKLCNLKQYLAVAQEWFQSTTLNNIQGWKAFPCVDAIMGCTHFIESLLLKHAFRVQVLPYEYAYYGLMGLHETQIGSLAAGVPLIVSLPNWYECDLRQDWHVVLKECEEKSIDIHIDMAWITTAKDICIDLNHPNIKSFAMSISKYCLAWNRIGIRWSRQRTMDSITMFNKWQPGVNTGLMSCGIFMMHNIPRDYGWLTYGDLALEICTQLGLCDTKIIHVARDLSDRSLWGIGKILGQQTPLSV